MTFYSSPYLLLLKQSLKSMHDGSHLSYHLFFFVVVCKDGGGILKSLRKVITVILLSFLYMGKMKRHASFNDRPTAASTNVPEYLSLSLWNVGFPGSLWQSVDVFLQGGDCSFVLPHTCISCIYCTSMYIIRWSTFVFMYGAHSLALKGSIM